MCRRGGCVQRRCVQRKSVQKKAVIPSKARDLGSRLHRQKAALDADLSRLRLTLRLISSRLDHMQPTFGLRKPRPPSRPRIFSRPDSPRAMRAADAGIILVMQRVVGHIVLMDVVPNLL